MTITDNPWRIASGHRGRWSVCRLAPSSTAAPEQFQTRKGTVWTTTNRKQAQQKAAELNHTNQP